MSGFDAIDDAVASAFYSIERERPSAFEQVGLLYDQKGTLLSTPILSRNRQGEVKGRFSIPTGSLKALFHTHPTANNENSRDRTVERFSTDDIDQAIKLQVPSYILANGKILRYDPQSGQSLEVLAQFPIEEWKKHLEQSLQLAKSTSTTRR